MTQTIDAFYLCDVCNGLFVLYDLGQYLIMKYGVHVY